MPIYAESLDALFVEQVARPIDRSLAGLVADLLSQFIDGLSAIELPHFVQPCTAFHSGHLRKGREAL